MPKEAPFDNPVQIRFAATHKAPDHVHFNVHRNCYVNSQGRAKFDEQWQDYRYTMTTTMRTMRWGDVSTSPATLWYGVKVKFRDGEWIPLTKMRRPALYPTPKEAQQAMRAAKKQFS